MFNGLIAWLAWLWSTIKAIWQACWEFIKTGWTWIVATIVGFIAITHQVSTFVVNVIGQVFDLINGVVLPNHNLSSPSVGTLMDFANYIFPLNEGLTLMSAYSLVLMSLTLYKLIKSWIPTL